MKKALLVIDVQTDVVKGAYQHDQTIRKINERINQYRKDDSSALIFIQHEDEELIRDSNGWQFDSMLDVKDDDIVVAKTHPNSFYRTRLQDVLNQLAITDLEICGAQTQYCVDTTIRIAHDRKYPVEIYRDTYTTVDNKFMDANTTNSYYADMWDGRFATVKEEI